MSEIFTKIVGWPTSILVIVSAFGLLGVAGNAFTGYKEFAVGKLGLITVNNFVMMLVLFAIFCGALITKLRAQRSAQ